MPPRKKTDSKKKTPLKEKPKKKMIVKTASKKETSKKAKTVQPKKESKKDSKKAVKLPQLLRGMRDLLPKDEPIWKKMYHVAEEISDAYNYGRIQTPVLEEATLFVKSIGKGTDVVEKEMYVFENKEGSKIALRPEMTASCVRAFMSHGMHVQPQPVKLWYLGPMYRHDRPQAGRYRQFFQYGGEVLGEKNAVIDAELVCMAYNFVRDMGINAQVKINSIGSLEDRAQYIIELVGYLRSKRSYLSEESKKRITKNPLRILDSKDEGDRMVIEDAPQIIDWLSEDSKSYFMSVLEYLDEAEIPYVLEPTLVRGLDYYTDTVFEIFMENSEVSGGNLALGGGGRYDGLVELLGGPKTPGCGFSIGLDRVANIVSAMQQEVGETFLDTKKVFFAHLGDQARRRMLKIIEDLRREGIKVYHNLAKPSLKSQMEIAAKYAVGYTFILGHKEVQDGTIIIRDMDSGTQEIIDQKKIGKAMQRILEKKA